MSIDHTTRPTTGLTDDPTFAYARPTLAAGGVAPGYDTGYGPAAYPPPPFPPVPPLPAPPTGGRRTGLIAAIVGLLVLAASGVGVFLLFFAHSTIDPDAVAREIARVTEQNDRTTPTGIRCPADVPFEKGRTFTCSATLLGRQVTYTITQNDDEGAITIDYTRPVLDPASVSQQIAAATTKELGVAPQAVQCPSDVRFQKGGTFTCSATLDGQALSYQLTQTDDDGGLTIAHDRVVAVEEVDDTLSAALTKDVGEEVVAACAEKGRTVLVNAPGAPISCGAANAADPARNAHVTAKIDADGTLTYTIQ